MPFLGRLAGEGEASSPCGGELFSRHPLALLPSAEMMLAGCVQVRSDAIGSAGVRVHPLRSSGRPWG